MSVRTSARQSPILFAGVLLFGAWVVLTAVRVFDAIPSIWTGGGDVGHTWLGGLVGLLVMVTIVGLLVALYGALSASSPTPDTFPPGGRRTER